MSVKKIDLFIFILKKNEKWEKFDVMLINAKVLIGGLIEGFGFEVLENDFNKSKYLYKRYEYLMTKWNQKNVSKLREIVTTYNLRNFSPIFLKSKDWKWTFLAKMSVIGTISGNR